MSNELELRLNETDKIEVRQGEAGKPNTLIGFAAVYNSLSADLGGFRERIIPGAFKDALTNGTDIRALIDHDSTRILGRLSAGTLKLTPADHGLQVEISLPNTTYANDLRESAMRGDIKGMSFGFRVPKDGQRFTKENGMNVRELTKIDLREVTVTSIPAYGDTSVALSVRVDPSVSEQIKESEPKENSEPEIVRCSRQLRYLMAND